MLVYKLQADFSLPFLVFINLFLILLLGTQMLVYKLQGDFS